jgi:hypothetical protein
LAEAAGGTIGPASSIDLAARRGDNNILIFYNIVFLSGGISVAIFMNKTIQPK